MTLAETKKLRLFSEIRMPLEGEKFHSADKYASEVNLGKSKAAADCAYAIVKIASERIDLNLLDYLL